MTARRASHGPRLGSAQWRVDASAAVLATVAILLLPLAAANALAADPTTRAIPTCVDVTPGPADVDLHAACVGRTIVDTYTSPQPGEPDTISRAFLAMVAGGIAAIVVLAIWDGARRRAAAHLESVPPTAFWICATCHSLNPDHPGNGSRTANRCYHCRASRPRDATIVDAAHPPSGEQLFGWRWEGGDPHDERRAPPGTV